MYAAAVRSKKAKKSRAVANSVGQNKSNLLKGIGFVDNRPKAISQRKLEALINNDAQGRKITQRFALRRDASGNDHQTIVKNNYKNRGTDGCESMLTARDQSTKAIQLGKEGNIYSVEITKELQQQKGWCYAATTVIMRRAIGDTTVTQMDVVREYLVRSNEVAAEIIGELPDEIIVDHYGDTYGTEYVEGYSFKQFTRDIVKIHLENDLPLVLGWGGHSTVITRYNAETDMLDVYDPMTGETNECPAEWMEEQEVLTVF